MSFFIVGDLHYKKDNIDETDLLEESILKYLCNVNVDAIVLLGDILDKHEDISSLVQTRAVKFMAKLIEHAHLYVIIGNHDLKDNKQYLSENHGFTAVKYWEKATVVDTVVNANIKGKMYTFVPYVPKGKFLEALHTGKEDFRNSACVFAHQEFRGSKMGSRVSEDGDNWEDYWPMVITGHIHDHQIINNIIVLGTPIQHRYSDSVRRVVLMVDFERMDMNMFELDGVIKKKIVTVYYDELSGYEVEKYNRLLKIKAKLKCTLEQSIIVDKHPKVIEMKNEGYFVKADILMSNSESIIVQDDKTYMDTYNDMLKEEGLDDFFLSLGVRTSYIL